MEEYRERVSKEFLQTLGTLAERAFENDANGVTFDVGTIDGITMSVEITFRYRRADE